MVYCRLLSLYSIEPNKKQTFMHIRESEFDGITTATRKSHVFFYDLWTYAFDLLIVCVVEFELVAISEPLMILASMRKWYAYFYYNQSNGLAKHHLDESALRVWCLVFVSFSIRHSEWICAWYWSGNSPNIHSLTRFILHCSIESKNYMKKNAHIQTNEHTHKRLPTGKIKSKIHSSAV